MNSGFGKGLLRAWQLARQARVIDAGEPMGDFSASRNGADGNAAFLGEHGRGHGGCGTGRHLFRRPVFRHPSLCWLRSCGAGASGTLLGGGTGRLSPGWRGRGACRGAETARPQAGPGSRLYASRAGAELGTNLPFAL
ncbi:hypothetical protein OCAR_4275 [Afipia carboxidovorans OM5]|nr:hypothetical protein OCAR_4275 [Afipia carboxidovorans OM5]